jgi:hypothetical protein
MESPEAFSAMVQELITSKDKWGALLFSGPDTDTVPEIFERLRLEALALLTNQLDLSAYAKVFITFTVALQRAGYTSDQFINQVYNELHLLAESKRVDPGGLTRKDT